MIYINGRFLTQKLKGVQRFAYEITKQLVELYNDRVCILMPDDDPDPAYDITRWPIMTVKGLNANMWEQFSLPLFLIKLNSPLLLNLANAAPAVYKNQVVCIHDVAYKYNPQWYSFLFYHWYNFLIPLLVKQSKKLITVSESSKNDIVKYLNAPGSKIEVINNAVGLGGLSTEVIDYQFLENLDIKRHSFFLSVSSIDPKKNFAGLIDAYLKSEVTNIPLVIAGSAGKEFPSINLKKKQVCPNIIFTGYISDAELLALYKSALCFIYPSFYEGFGIPPLEAMVCGCPTIVSDIASLKEVCGGASLYINPFSIESMADALNAIVSDAALRNNLVRKGKERAKLYNWRKSAEKLITLIETL